MCVYAMSGWIIMLCNMVDSLFFSEALIQCLVVPSIVLCCSKSLDSFPGIWRTSFPGSSRGGSRAWYTLLTHAQEFMEKRQ